MWKLREALRLRASAFLEEMRVRQDGVAKALDLEDGSSTINAKTGKVEASWMGHLFPRNVVACPLHGDSGVATNNLRH
jgi:hypothetical protein